MSIINFWSTIAPVLASALFSPVAPLGVDRLQPLTLQSQPTIATEPPAVPMTADTREFIIVPPPVAKSVTPDRGSAKSLNALVADLSTRQTSDVSHDCLAAAVYYESRAEPLEGQLAVAEVVINRTQAPNFRRTICGVVKQPNQFSFVRGGAIPLPDRNSRSWRRAVAVAKIARENLWSSRAAAALYFHADHVSPSWKRRFKAQATLGNHIFYR